MDFFGYGYGYGSPNYGHQLREQGQGIRDAKRTARRSQEDTDDLRTRVDRLHLATTAMWELLCERTGLDEDDLLAKIQEIDLRDGKRDGRIDTRASASPVECPECTRTNNARRTACLYCGVELPPTSPL